MTDASQESNPRDRLSRPTEPLPDSQADLSQAKGAKEWTQARMPEPEGAVALHIGVRGWGLVGGLLLVLGGLLPEIWKAFEPLDAGPDWRIPSESSEDYWLVNRWTNEVAHQQHVLLVGDSVVWGEFSKPDETLASYLNALSPEVTFSNGGLKGLCPLAYSALLSGVISVRRQTGIVLHFNPIWLTSPQRDLQENRPTLVNHQMLLPQVWPDLPAYQPDWNTRIGNLVGRNLGLFQWARHLRIDDFQGQDFQSWTLEHPARFPWAGIALDSPQPRDHAASQYRPSKRAIRKSTYSWVDRNSSSDGSLQLVGFQRAIEALQQQGCPVFCLVGRLNPALQTSESLENEQAIQQNLLNWLEKKQVLYTRLPAEPQWMADSSHPLPLGYRVQADVVWQDPLFQSWLQSLR